METAQKQAF